MYECENSPLDHMNYLKLTIQVFMFNNICMGKIPPPHKRVFFSLQNYHIVYDIIKCIQ
jgi:hypothetical protein